MEPGQGEEGREEEDAEEKERNDDREVRSGRMMGVIQGCDQTYTWLKRLLRLMQHDPFSSCRGYSEHIDRQITSQRLRMHRGDNGARERDFQIPLFPRTCEMDQREMSEGTRHAGGEERLTFDPGRPISPWRRTNEGRGDVALVSAHKDTHTHKYFKTNKTTKHKPSPLLVLLCRVIHQDPEK